MNRSSLLPGTFHVLHPNKSWLEPENIVSSDIVSWLEQVPSGRVDVFAYENDEPLDHQKLYSVECGKFEWGDALEWQWLESWWAMLDDEHGHVDGYILYAFSDKDTAITFKLTFGGMN